MGFTGKGDDAFAQDGAVAAVNARKKTAERQRLAEALRANLGRRKAQGRDRRAGEEKKGEAAERQK